MELTLTDRDIFEIKQKLADCSSVLVTFADQTNLQIINAMLNGPCNGSRAVEISKNAALSRSSVSFRLRTLVKAGIVCERKEGTQFFYYLNPSKKQVLKLKNFFDTLYSLLDSLPDRQGDELNGNKV